MRESLNILILGNLAPYRIGGAEVQARLLAERFSQRGHRVTVAGHGNPDGRIEASGYRVDTICLRTFRQHRMIRAISYGAALIRFLLSNRSRFDVVLCYMLGESDLVVSLLKQVRLLDLPLVVCSAGFGRSGDAARLNSLPYFTTLIAMLKRQSNAINIISPHIETELVETGLGGNFTHIPNGVPINPTLLSSEPGTGEARSFLFAGRLVRLKGCADLLEAIRMVNSSAIAFKVNIVGDGPEYIALRELSESLGIEATVSFHGAVTPDRMAAHYQTNTVLVLPSHCEAQGVVVAEAMSHGLPVIVTQSGGPEFTVNEQMAHVVPPKDPKALADAMEQMLRMTEGKLGTMGARARRHVEEHFDIEKVTDQYIDLFYQLRADRGT